MPISVTFAREKKQRKKRVAEQLIIEETEKKNEKNE